MNTPAASSGSSGDGMEQKQFPPDKPVETTLVTGLSQRTPQERSPPPSSGDWVCPVKPRGYSATRVRLSATQQAKEREPEHNPAQGTPARVDTSWASERVIQMMDNLHTEMRWMSQCMDAIEHHNAEPQPPSA